MDRTLLLHISLALLIWHFNLVTQLLFFLSVNPSPLHRLFQQFDRLDSKSFLFHNHHLKFILSIQIAIVFIMSFHCWKFSNCFLLPLKLIQILQHYAYSDVSLLLQIYLCNSPPWNLHFLQALFIYLFLFYVKYMSFVTTGLCTKFPFFRAHSSLFFA